MLVQLPSGHWVNPEHVTAVKLVPSLALTRECVSTPFIKVETSGGDVMAKDLQTYKDDEGMKEAESERDKIAELLNVK